MSLTNDQLITSANNDGGVFDVLIGAVKAHLKEEYDSSRIRGTEYSSVYLGSLTEVLNQAVQFLLEREKRGIEIEILELEKQIAGQNLLKVQAEVELVQENIELVKLQQPKLEAETLLTQRKADTELDQQKVLQAQECKLKAEFDVLVEQKAKTAAETGFVNQKKVTEQAQTSSSGVDAASLVGRQCHLYAAQAGGFDRDAEQKVAKLMVDSWNVRRTTDEGVSANNTNKLGDEFVGRAVERLLGGINA